MGLRVCNDCFRKAENQNKCEHCGSERVGERSKNDKQTKKIVAEATLVERPAIQQIPQKVKVVAQEKPKVERKDIVIGGFAQLAIAIVYTDILFTSEFFKNAIFALVHSSEESHLLTEWELQMHYELYRGFVQLFAFFGFLPLIMSIEERTHKASWFTAICVAIPATVQVFNFLPRNWIVAFWSLNWFVTGVIVFVDSFLVLMQLVFVFGMLGGKNGEW